MDKPNDDKQSAVLTTDLIDQLPKIIPAVSDLTRNARQSAREGSVWLLLIFALVMIIGAVALRAILPDRVGLIEFSVLVGAGTLLFISGGVMGLSQFKAQSEIEREIRQQAFRVLHAEQINAMASASVAGGEAPIGNVVEERVPD